MPILTNSGRVVIAESVALRPIHVAWGTGDGLWNAPPSESASATSLMDEVGRRVATEVAFVVSDPLGEIVLPTGSFSRSAVPTENLYVRAAFGFSDSPSSVIRELGVFVGAETVAGLPPGQQFFIPAEIEDPGRMLHLEHFVPIFRSPAIRESFEVIISF